MRWSLSSRLGAVAFLIPVFLSIIASAAAAAPAASAPATSQSPAVLLEQGIYAEQTKGDLDEAIRIYEQVVQADQSSRRAAAEALWRMGQCWEKKKDRTKAAEQYRLIVARYADHTLFRDKAAERLAAMGMGQSQAPRIVASSPQPYAEDVPATTTELTVTFDQPMMDGSWSWTQRFEGANPQDMGKPKYDPDRRTCRVSVKLEPGKWYWVGINSPNHHFFQTAARVSAEPYVLLFATAAADGKPTPIPPDKLQFAKRINAAHQAAVSGQVHPVLKVAREFLDALAQGRDEQATGMAQPGTVKVTGFPQLRAHLDLSGVTIVKALANSTDACVLTGPMPFRDRAGLAAMGLGLRKQGDRWLVRDIDALPTPDAARQFREGYIKANPDGRELPLSPALSSDVSDDDRAAAETLNAQGWQLWQQRKLPEAQKLFERAVKLDPNNANAWNGLGWSLFNQGQPVNAKRAFEKAVAIDPKAAASLNGLGWIAKNAGQTDQAIGYWKQAIEAVPSATAAALGLAQTYLEKKDYAKAAEYYQMVLKYEPENAQAKEGLAKATAASKPAGG